MATNEYTATDYHGFRDPEFGTKKYHEYWSSNLSDFDIRIVKKGTKADRPSAGTEGRWYLAVGEPAIYYDDGSAWQKVAGTDASGETMSADEFLATADGSTTDPAFAWDGDQDTGLYRVGADTIGVTTGGTKAAEFGAGGGLTLPNGGATVSGDIDDGTNTIFDSTNVWVPLSILEANSITLNGGAGLKNGATAQLGGSFSLDVEPADFAGAFLADDGTDALQANLGSGVEGDGTDNIRVDAATVAGAFLSAGANPYQLAVNLGAFLSGDGSDNVQVNLGSMLTGDGADNITLSLGSGVKDATGSVAVEPADIAGALLQDDGADNLEVIEGNISHDAIDQTTVDSADHHTRPTAGDGLTDDTDTFNIEPADFAGSFLSDDGSDNLQVDTGDGLEGDGAGAIQTEEPFVYDPGMTEWTDGLSNEEIDRIVLQTGETLVIDRIEFRQKGGGSSTSASIDVRDTTAASTIGSQDLGGTTKDPGSSGSGNTVIVRVTNSTGAAINAAPRVTGRIQGA